MSEEHDPAAALEQASQAFMAGNFQEALDVWTTTLSVVENEHHYALHTNRGAALERLGRIQDAIEAYDQALQSKPDHVEALHNRGVALKATKQFETALASFEAALSHNPSFYPSMRGKTDVLTAMERFDEAIDAAAAASALKPEDAGPVADRAFNLLKARRLEEAIAEYSRARALGDSSSETLRLQAIALSQRAVELDKEGKLAEAEGYYSQAIEMEATESRVFNRAYLYMRLGKLEEAMAGYRQVMGISATNFQARAALGTLLLQKEDFAGAVSVLGEAQLLKPDQADVVFNLGFALLKQGELDAAEAQFKTALELDPSMEQARNGVQAVEAMRGSGAGGAGGADGEEGKPTKYKLEVGDSITAPSSIASSAAAGAAEEEQQHQQQQQYHHGHSADAAAAHATHSAPAAGAGASPAGPRHTTPTAASGGGSGSAVAALAARRSSVNLPGSSSVPSYAAIPALTSGGFSSSASKPKPMAFLGSGVPLPTAELKGMHLQDSAESAAPARRFSVDGDGFEGLIFTYAQLKSPGPYPDGVDSSHRESYLSMSDFAKVFGMGKAAFFALPKWKRIDLRKKVGLF